MPMFVSGWEWLEGIRMVLSLFLMLCKSPMSVKKKSRRKKNDAQPIDDFQININRDKQVNQ